MDVQISEQGLDGHVCRVRGLNRGIKKRVGCISCDTRTAQTKDGGGTLEDGDPMDRVQ